MRASSQEGQEVDYSKAHRQTLDRYVDVGPVNNSMKLSTYYGMSRQILLQAQQFRAQHDIDRAYIFYKRFLRLAVNCIPDHVTYRDVKFTQDKIWLIAERRHAMNALEEIKVEMDEEIKRHCLPQRLMPSGTTSTRTKEEEELEIRLRNLRGYDAASTKQLNSPLGDSESLYDELLFSSPEQAQGLQPPSMIQLEPSAPPLEDGPRGASDDPYSTNPAAAIDFETAFKSLRIQDGDKETAAGGVRYYPSVASPMLPKKEPSRMEDGPEGWLSRRGKMRTVVLASGLIGKFLDIASPNSRKRPDGIETCGVLAGTQDKDTVRFTTLIIPKQEGSCNTVSTTHEEELYFYCEEHNLIQLGWIHTHPSQDCFMSSVDIHTHCAYQTMLPEAVAVVVSLRDARKRVGVFRLTEPDGMELIQQCTLRGFHPHPVPDHEIYKDHHRVLWHDEGFTVIDQR